MNLLEPFLASAERHARRTAIVDGDGGHTSFGELIALSAGLAGAWRRAGIGRGDRVLIAMPLGPKLYAGLAALWRLGAVAVLPEPALGLKGLRHAAGATAPKAYLADGWFRLLRYAIPELWRVPLMITPGNGTATGEAVESVPADHPALISFTSGSTGRSKAIMRSHGFLRAQDAALAGLIAPRRDDETDLVAFPVFVIANLGLGITSVLPNWNLRRHDEAGAEAIAAHVARHHVTRALVPPSICETLAGGGTALPLDALFTGGGPVFPDLLERLAARLPRGDIVAVYGSTEAEPIAHLHAREIAASDWHAMKAGAGLLAGTPVPDVRLVIRGDEIVVTGDHVNKGYLDAADDASTKLSLDGEIWHRTGDAGRLDETGRLWLGGRLDGKAGGLFPFGVEAAARFWPGVRRCALLALDGTAILAVEGDDSQAEAWQREAQRLGEIRIVPLKAIPLDRRHRSKVDYPTLRERVKAAGGAI